MAQGLLSGLRQPYNQGVYGTGSNPLAENVGGGLRDMVAPTQPVFDPTNTFKYDYSSALTGMTSPSSASGMANGFDFNSLLGNQNFLGLPDEQKLKLLQMLMNNQGQMPMNNKPRFEAYGGSLGRLRGLV